MLNTACTPPYRLPCRLRVLRQNDRTCPSRRTAEKQESSVESRADGKPSGQTPAQSSPLPQSSVSRMARCCSITCWACCEEDGADRFIHQDDDSVLILQKNYSRSWADNDDDALVPFGWRWCAGTGSTPLHRRAAGHWVNPLLCAAGRTAGWQHGGGRPQRRQGSLNDRSQSSFLTLQFQTVIITLSIPFFNYHLIIPSREQL